MYFMGEKTIMVKKIGRTKRRLFDEDADGPQSKGRVFTLKKNTGPTKTKNEVLVMGAKTRQ